MNECIYKTISLCFTIMKMFRKENYREMKDKHSNLLLRFDCKNQSKHMVMMSVYLFEVQKIF